MPTEPTETISWTNMVLAALGGAGGVGAVLTGVYNYLLSRRKAISDGKIAEVKTENETKLSEMRLVVESFQLLFVQMNARIKSLEDSHKDCTENNAKLEREVGSLRAGNTSLQEEVNELKEEIFTLKKKDK